MRHVGLINCDPLTPQVIERYGDYPTMFADLFALVTDAIQWKIYDATQKQLPGRANACDAYLITGSQFSVTDNDEWIQSLFGFIRTLWQSKVKTVGICFGHQAIAQAMGGHVDRAANGWGMGVAKTTITKQTPWMRPWQRSFNVHISHQDQVLRLPPDGHCLAKTNHCANAIMHIGDTFISFQGHPEFNQDYTRFLINKRKNLFMPPVYQAFIDSLSQTVDTILLAQWIDNFIASQ